MTESLKQTWKKWTVPIALLLTWELGVRFDFINALFFPAPITVLGAFFAMFSEGELVSDFLITVSRVVFGVCVGGSIGLFVGLGMGWNRHFHAGASGLISMTHPLPKIALLPLFFVIFGYGEPTRLILVSLTAFFPMVIASRMAITTMDTSLLDVCKNYNVRGGLFLRRMVLPACKPVILAGLQLAINTTLIVSLSIEMLASNTGLGAILWSGWQTMRLEDIYVALFIIALMGVLVNSLIFRTGRH